MHSDVFGPLSVSIEAHRYFCNFLNQYSRYTHVACLSTKKDDGSTFKVYTSLPNIRKCFSKGVVRLHTAGGTEYKPILNTFKTFTAPHTSQHNPFGEHLFHTIFEPARTIMEKAGLGRKYWSYAVERVTYVKNRLLYSALGCKPLEKLTAKRSSLCHVRIFRRSAFI